MPRHQSIVSSLSASALEQVRKIIAKAIHSRSLPGFGNIRPRPKERSPRNELRLQGDDAIPRTFEQVFREADPAVLAIYQTLWARYDNHTDLIWRVPAFILTADTLIFAGIFTINSRLAVGVLGCLGALISFVGLFTMRRFDLSALVDRSLLDIYEQRLLDRVDVAGSSDRPWPRLAHGTRFPDRVRILAAEQGLPAGSIPRGIFYGGTRNSKLGRTAQAIDRLVVSRFPSSGGWYALLALVGIVSLAWGVLFATGIVGVSLHH